MKHRVHHAGHRNPGPGADGKQQGIVRVAEPAAHHFFDLGHGGLQLLLESGRKLVVMLVIVNAGLGADGEAGRHRDADVGHLGQVGALAAENIFHRGVAFGAAGGERVNVFSHCHPPTFFLQNLQFAEIGHLAEHGGNGLQQCQPVVFQGLVLHHDHDMIKKSVDRRPEVGHRFQGG